MKIDELLAPDGVIVGLRVADKGQLVQELAKRAAPQLGIAAPAIATPLLEREQLGSTGLGKGFALPHARVAGLDRCFGLFARLARPVDFQAIDERPVDLVFLLLIPLDAEGAHVAALAAISRRMRDAALLDRVRKAGTADAVYRLIADG
jgi:PTS system nitrogen regulatory IIA component